MAASGNGYDRRFSSYARELDAAIERVVAHFEENDVALRLDVLRGLTVHAKLAFEGERLKQRLLQHPVSKELIERVTTQSTAFERLHKAMAVEEFSCEYDRRRNVEMQATLRWELPAGKPTKSKGKRRSRADTPLWTRYSFSRVADKDDGETVVTYSVAVGVGADGEIKELVKYQVASDSPYPRSFYEEDQSMGSDDEGEEGEEEEEEGDEPAGEKEPSDDGDEEEDKHEEGDEAEEEKDEFGEQVRGFDFNDSVLDAMLEWLGAEEEELDPADVIGFFLAVPIYEDDWMVDERVCQILFNSGGGDSEMEEEIVSDFGDEDVEDDDGDDDGDVAVADLD